MDGNHSLLVVVSRESLCGDAQAPLIINIVLGLPANICVMWLILAKPGNKAAEIFSLNQAVCEVVICMSNVLLLTAINTIRSSAAIFTYNQYGMKFFLGFLCSGRPLFMSCVCVERYAAVVHPVTFLKYKLPRYRVAGSVMCWLTVLVCSLILMWIPFPAVYYVSFAMVFTWFLVQLFCCAETLRSLVRPGPGEGTREMSGMNSAKLKAYRIIIIITVSVALTYLPFVIPIISYGLLSKEDSSKLFCVANCVALVTGFVPPFLYIHRAGKLQHCVKGTPT